MVIHSTARRSRTRRPKAAPPPDAAAFSEDKKKAPARAGAFSIEISRS